MPRAEDFEGRDPAELIDEARSYVGDVVGKPKVGRDPVNLPMIHHWCQALDDHNPAYLDADDAAATRHGQLVAPPAMLQTWVMDAPEKDEDGPQPQVLERLNAAGYSSVVATDYEHTYLRELVPGDVVSQETSVESLVGPKTTGLGEGFFVVLKHDYRDATGELVGIGRMKLLKFKPPVRSGDATDAKPKARRAPERPDIIQNEDSAHFWSAVAEGRLLVQRCTACGELRHPPRPMCPHCRSTDWDTIEASGRGTIHSYVVHHHPPLPGIQTPHPIVLVDLEEGVRLISHLTDDTDPAAIAIGQAVEVVYEEVKPGQTLPLFRLAGDDASEADGATPRSLTAADLTRGQRLPQQRLELTPTLIVGTAIASRDYQDVHHDRDAAVARGTEDIFMNILSTNGFVIRFVTDFLGPDAVVEEAKIRLGVPNYAGDTMRLLGELTAIEVRDDDALVTIAVSGRNSRGEHVSGTVAASVAREASA